MNTQLIDDLAAQAWRYANNYTGPEVMPVIKIFHRKLAELIVLECVNIVDALDSVRLETFHRVDGSKVETGHVLKQLFGITP